MTDVRPAKPRSRLGWLLPVVIAFAGGFLVLTGAFSVIDHLPAPKPGGGTGKLTLQGVLQSVAPLLKERCARSAKAALTQRGLDTSRDKIAATIDNYCTCAVDRSTNELRIRDLLAFKLNPSSEPVASKMKDIMQTCRESAG